MQCMQRKMNNFNISTKDLHIQLFVFLILHDHFRFFTLDSNNTCIKILKIKQSFIIIINFDEVEIRIYIIT